MLMLGSSTGSNTVPTALLYQTLFVILLYYYSDEVYKGIPDEVYKGIPDEAYKGTPDEAYKGGSR